MEKEKAQYYGLKPLSYHLNLRASMKIGMILAFIIFPLTNVKAGIFDYFLGKKEECSTSIIEMEDKKVSPVEMIHKEDMDISITSLFSITSDQEIEDAFLAKYNSIFFKNRCIDKTSAPKGNILIESCQDIYRIKFPKINEKLKINTMYSDKSLDYYYRTTIQLECIKSCHEKALRKQTCGVDEKKVVEQSNSGRNIIKAKEENIHSNKDDSSSTSSK
ncbi:MAG: hypothetical protein PHY93_17510 [Bacteriovorax sp.]|nr:hypothetical protein [Bacteriovorax sp.]